MAPFHRSYTTPYQSTIVISSSCTIFEFETYRDLEI